MLNKKQKEHNDLSDLKKCNGDLLDLYKEIKKEAKANRSDIVLNALNEIDLDLDYKSVRMKELTPEEIDSEVLLSGLIKEALIDAQELLKKGTDYGVQLALNRAETMIADRKIAKSPFLVETYRNFDSNLWNIVKLRELAYGEILKLKKKQDDITRSALQESDSMMRVRYFEDIRVLEKDILRLENEAHRYDTYQTALHSEKVLKNVLKQYAIPKEEQVPLIQFEEIIQKYEGKE